MSADVLSGHKNDHTCGLVANSATSHSLFSLFHTVIHRPDTKYWGVFMGAIQHIV